jgi:D-alanine-D-alanine ligase
MNNMIKLGVIFGGPTVEHEVSVISAVQAMKSLDTEKYDIYPIYIAKDRTWYTGKMLMDIDIYRDFDNLKRFAKKVVLVNKNGSFILKTLGTISKTVTDLDVVLPIVHGNNMEDGTIQGYLEMVGIPYVGSGIIGSSLGQDKVIMKQVFSSVGIPVVPYVWFFDYQYYENKEEIKKDVSKLDYPVIVKPATLGSSVGISFVKEEKDLFKAIEEAITYDRKIVIEKAVTNLVEVNCSVLGSYEKMEASVLEEVMSTKEFLTYQDKYVGSSKVKGKIPNGSKGMASASRIIPARLDSDTTLKIQNIAKDAFMALNLSGVCRIDFLVDGKTNKVYINEPNTIPGSLSFYLWEKSGKSYTDLLDEMITIAIKDYKNKSKKVTTFDTNILSSFNGLKGAKGIKGKLN